MTATLTVSEGIKQWIEQGWLSHTDRVFVSFLKNMEPTANEVLLWAAALVSHQLSQGDVYLDIAKLTQNLELTLGISFHDNEQKKNADLVKIKSYTLKDWENGLMNSALVGRGEGVSPLVLAGDRLYLRRYWQSQQMVSQSINKRLNPIRHELPEALKDHVQELFINNK